jgi:hypothetical protein
VAVGLALTIGLAGREAAACKCSYDGTPIAGPKITGEPIDLQGESVQLRCDRARQRDLVCTWKAAYVLRNGEAARTIELVVAHVAGAAVTLRLGEVVAGASQAQEIAAQRWAADHGWAPEGETRATWAAPANGTVTLTVDATFLVTPWGCTCADGGSNYRRHPWVSARTSRRYFVNYKAVGEWRAQPATMTVEHDIPRRWTGDRDLKYRRDGDRKRAKQATPRPSSDRWDEHALFTMYRRWRVDPGGPVVGAGLGWGPEGLRPRLRIGYELAYPRVLVNSVVVETDARRRVMIVPSWELTFGDGWPVFLPDIGAGLGVPIEVVPEARPGVRVHGRFGFWIFHLIGSFDHFPAIRGLGIQRLGSLALQVGF